jgi:hypothetical protein
MAAHLIILACTATPRGICLQVALTDSQCIPDWMWIPD